MNNSEKRNKLILQIILFAMIKQTKLDLPFPLNILIQFAKKLETTYVIMNKLFK